MIARRSRRREPRTPEQLEERVMRLVRGLLVGAAIMAVAIVLALWRIETVASDAGDTADAGRTTALAVADVVAAQQRQRYASTLFACHQRNRQNRAARATNAGILRFLRRVAPGIVDAAREFFPTDGERLPIESDCVRYARANAPRLR